MAKIRVLIVDESVMMRTVLADALSRDPSVEVVGTAATASIAMQKMPQVNPDLVITDLEMLDGDGVDMITRLRATSPRLPVLMCSAPTEVGAETALKGLANGASDYVAKPGRVSSTLTDALGAFKSEILTKVKALGGAFPSGAPEWKQTVRIPRNRIARDAVTALGIGCSTGGPNALAALFEGFPRDLGIPIFIVQHMPPVFTKMLASRLTASSRVQVKEAAHGDSVESNVAYLAPGNFHMTVVREGPSTRIALNQETPENSCRPAVDVLFRSMAKLYGAGVLATVMTGMGQDGTRGARAIVDAGGALIVQDAASCVVASMPRSVVKAGLAAGEFPLDQLAHELVLRVRRSAPTPTGQPTSRRLEAT